MKTSSHKDIGNKGESAVVEYLRRLGFTILDRNVSFKTGELDVVAQKGRVMHIVEVKSLTCDTFPSAVAADRYDPADNLHANKLRKVARTAEWEWQIDGALVWIRRGDGVAKVRYLPQVL
jgi:Holliday junction resolvase-like predicted endonuclease